MCAAARVQELVVPAGGPAALGVRKKPVQLMADDRRVHTRLPISATVRLKRIAGRPEVQICDYQGMDISCSGIRFQLDREIPPGTAVDLEIILLPKPIDGQAVKMFTAATVVRSESPNAAGWHGIAVCFDDIAISRDAIRSGSC